MKELKINYQEYVLPRETNNFQRVGKFVCEYFGFKTYRVDKTFSIKVENPDLFLANNKSFTVDPVILPKAEDEYQEEAKIGEKEPQNAKFSILKWEYEFDEADSHEIAVTTKKHKSPQIETLYASSEKWQFYFPLYSVAIFGFLVFSAYIFVTGYPEPIWYWSFVGTYIQKTVAWSLGLLMFLLFTWSIFLYKGSVIIKSYLNFALPLLVFILPFTWLIMSAKPVEFVGAPNEHILYLSYLQNRFSSVLLILLGTVPWLTIFLKHFGLSLIPTILGKLHGTFAKPKK